MKPGQVLTKWWQDYVAGRLRTPQAIVQAARCECPPVPDAVDRLLDGPPEDGVIWDAPERLRSPSFIGTTGYMKQQERADWAHADRRLRTWAAMVVEEGRTRGVPLYVHACLRGQKEQNELVRKGVSKAKYPTSAHNIGEAVDIVHGIYHWEMSKAEWQVIHTLGLRCLDRLNSQLSGKDKLSLTWGGNFKSLYDPAHWEISDYRQRIRMLPVAPILRLTPKAILVRWRQGL